MYLLWYLYITDDLHVWFNIHPLCLSLEVIYLTKYTHLCTVDINLQPFFKLLQYIYIFILMLWYACQSIWSVMPIHIKNDLFYIFQYRCGNTPIGYNSTEKRNAVSLNKINPKKYAHDFYVVCYVAIAKICTPSPFTCVLQGIYVSTLWFMTFLISR